MRKIAIAISKGGTGKTTTAVNLAHGLALLGEEVLLIDTDTQGQAGAMLGVNTSRGLADVLLGKSSDSFIERARENLYLLAGGRRMAAAKRSIETQSFQIERLLSEKLKVYEGEFDFVLVDSGPGWDTLSINILFYVSEVLAPVSMEALSLHSLGEFFRRVEDIKAAGARAVLRYLLPTFVDGRVKKSDEIFRQLEGHFKAEICAPIRYNVKLSEAPAYHQTIFEYAKKSTGAFDYGKLVERVLRG